MQKLPIVSKLNEIDVKKIQGQSIFDFYKQIEKILQQASNNNEITITFSEPIVNNVREEISWYTKVSGNAREMKSLQPAERIQVFEKIKKFSILIDEIIKKLEEKSGEKSLGVEALRSIFITPNIEKTLFVVGSSLVIAEWGCTPHGADPRDHDLTLLDYKSILSENIEEIKSNIISKANSNKYVLNVESVESSKLKSTESPESILTPSDEIKSDLIIHQEAYIPKEKFVWEIWWRWIIILALTLLLIMNVFDKNNYPIIFKYNFISEAQLRTDIRDLWRKMQDKSQSCKEIKTVPIEQSLSSPIEPLQIQPTVVPKPLDQNALDNKDISVFEGGWQMTSDNLVESGTDKKLKFSLFFDAQGNGKVSIQKIDGVVCSSDSAVNIESKARFIVTTPNLSCDNDSRSFNASLNGKIICTLITTNKANCSLQCVNGECSAEFEKAN